MCSNFVVEIVHVLMLFYASQTFVLMVINGLATHDYKTCLTYQKGMVDFVATILGDFGFFGLISDRGFM